MHYIKETNHLNELCSKLNKSEFLSIDTEFIREKTYWSKLCLIQICTHNKEIIIDPLENNIDFIHSKIKPKLFSKDKCRILVLPAKQSVGCI